MLTRLHVFWFHHLQKLLFNSTNKHLWFAKKVLFEKGGLGKYQCHIYANVSILVRSSTGNKITPPPVQPRFGEKEALIHWNEDRGQAVS